MAREPGTKDECACGAKLIFLTNLRTGKTIPVELRATTVYVQDPDGIHCLPVNVHVTAEGKQREASIHINHFQTCPKRDQFRRPNIPPRRPE